MTGLALKYSTGFGIARGIDALVYSGINNIMKIKPEHSRANRISEIGSGVITSAATFWLPMYLSKSNVLKENPYLRYASPILEKRMFVSAIGNACFAVWHLAAFIGAEIINKDNTLLAGEDYSQVKAALAENQFQAALAENHFKAALKFAWRATFDGLAMSFLSSESIKYLTYAEGLLNTIAPGYMRNAYDSVTDFIDNKIIGKEVSRLDIIIDEEFDEIDREDSLNSKFPSLPPPPKASMPPPKASMPSSSSMAPSLMEFPEPLSSVASSASSQYIEFDPQFPAPPNSSYQSRDIKVLERGPDGKYATIRLPRRNQLQ
jgi:hypothetical protein